MPEDFYYLLYSALIANCPVDTHNMQQNITLEDYGDYWVIIVSGPRIGYDYASVVNKGRQDRAPVGKEVANIGWIERTINQVCQAIGVNIEYELS